jgi:hypothetical protein
VGRRDGLDAVEYKEFFAPHGRSSLKPSIYYLYVTLGINTFVFIIGLLSLLIF